MYIDGSRKLIYSFEMYYMKMKKTDKIIVNYLSN